MSFVLQYRHLFSILVQEEVSGAALTGFSFAPSPSTRKRLQDHHLVFRAFPGGCAVDYQLNPLAPEPLLGPIKERVRFTFHMAQSALDFFAGYEPTLSAANGPQLYLDNLTPAGTVQPFTQPELSAGTSVQSADAVEILPLAFSAASNAGAAGAPTHFVVRSKFDPATVVLDVPISAPPGVAQGMTRIDLSDQPPGPYTLETDAAGAFARTIYVDDELAGARALGLVDVYWETAQDNAPAGGAAYLIRFRKR